MSGFSLRGRHSRVFCGRVSAGRDASASLSCRGHPAVCRRARARHPRAVFHRYRHGLRLRPGRGRRAPFNARFHYRERRRRPGAGLSGLAREPPSDRARHSHRRAGQLLRRHRAAQLFGALDAQLCGAARRPSRALGRRTPGANQHGRGPSRSERAFTVSARRGRLAGQHVCGLLGQLRRGTHVEVARSGCRP